MGFLNRIFDNNQAIIDFLQRLTGYCCTGHVREHVFVFPVSFYSHGGTREGGGRPKGGQNKRSIRCFGGGERKGTVAGPVHAQGAA
jgi:hypothetical protein